MKRLSTLMVLVLLAVLMVVGAPSSVSAAPSVPAFTQVATSPNATCALDAGGQAWCWGSDISGALGDGNPLSLRSTPAPVSGSQVFTQIVGGGLSELGTQYRDFFCGLTSAGTAYCWGDGFTTTPGLITSGVTFNKISAGGTVGCGLTVAGAAYCWGSAGANATAVAGGITFTAIASGSWQNCGIAVGGTPYCWTGVSTPAVVSGGVALTSVTVGQTDACGLTAAGAAYCWGGNASGEVGDGTTSGRSPETAVSGALVFSSISEGWGSTCAVTTSNTGYCWGYNAYGTVGDGTTTNRLVPTAVSGGLSFNSLDLDRYHACAFTTTNQLKCWGSEEGGATASGTTNPVATSPIATNQQFLNVSAGGESTCGVSLTNSAYCWGYNGSRNLGEGTGNNRSLPTAVSGGLSFSTTSYGFMYGCGLTTTNAAYCWGNGTLGNGTGTSSAIPVPVSGGLSFKAIGVSASTNNSAHTCALTLAGAAYCWGDDNFGQLGDGGSTSQLTPVAVNGGLTFSSISVGMYNSCALTSAGAAYCWGFNTNNELGDGTGTNRSTPTAVSGARTYASISVGAHSSCALTSAGAAYCWGENGHGEVGDGSAGNKSVPVAVAGGLSFSSISSGSTYVYNLSPFSDPHAHTCAITTGGSTYCWGDNHFGQLGNFSTVEQHSPVAVSGSYTFVSVSSGGGHTCGLTSAGWLYCWGLNLAGQLGTVSLNFVTPVDVQISNASVVISATIDPTFTFTVTGQGTACNGESNFVTSAGSATAVALGHVSSATNASGAQALSVASNAGGGFTVYLRGTQATGNLRSAGHNWVDAAGTYATPAALSGESFGFTYKDSTVATSVTNPGSALFAALDNNNRAVMGSSSSATGSACVSFDAASTATTPAGSYSASLIYTAVPVF